MSTVTLAIDQVFIRLMLRGELEVRGIPYRERCKSLGADVVQWYMEIYFHTAEEAVLFKLRDWPLFLEKYQ